MNAFGRAALAAAALFIATAVPAAAQLYRVPSTAMAPTLVFGTIVLFAPYEGIEPQAGDIVALKTRRDTSVVYFDRIIGLPGDQVQITGGRLVINGTTIEQTAEGTFPNPVNDGRESVERWRETLPNGVSYSVLNSEDGSVIDDTPLFDVPSEHYFVMGDNRDNSVDSRLPDYGLGFISRANIGQLVTIPSAGNRT